MFGAFPHALVHGEQVGLGRCTRQRTSNVQAPHKTVPKISSQESMRNNAKDTFGSAEARLSSKPRNGNLSHLAYVWELNQRIEACLVVVTFHADTPAIKRNRTCETPRACEAPCTFVQRKRSDPPPLGLVRRAGFQSHSRKAFPDFLTA